MGVRQHISALGGPQALGPLSCTGSRSCSQPALTPRGVRGSGRGDSARVGDSMDAQPHSSAWEQQDWWHQGGGLAAVSVVLSPKLLSTGVTTRPQGLSEAGGLRVRWGPLTISGPSRRTRLIVPAQLGLSPAAHRRPHPGGSDPNPELPASPASGVTEHRSHACVLLPVTALSHTRAGSAHWLPGLWGHS